MSLWKLVAVFLLAIASGLAQLPELRIEATGGGSVIHVRNGSKQPLTALLIELVNYPGSSFSFLQDDLANPIAAGSEKRIPVSSMMVGAAPEYVKVQAALYADGSSAGVPEKVTQLIDGRRTVLETTRELIRRLEKAKASGADKAAIIADLKEWAGAVQLSPANQAYRRGVIANTVTRLGANSVDEALTGLRTSERALAASKPAL